jgi:hypothetical protein
METKLTLKLDPKVINSAKKYAENNNLTLSQLVEDYFKDLLSDMQKFEYPPLVKKLSGIISENDLKRLSQNDDRIKRILGEEA